MTNNIDLKLISELEDDGRTSYLKLSKMLGVSVSTIANKVNYLLKSGVINIAAVPNPDNMKLNTNALIGMNVSMDSIDEVCATFQNHFNVYMVATTFGRFNLLVATHFPTREKLDQFIASGYLRRKDIYEIEIFFSKELIKPRRKNFANLDPGPNLSNLDDIDQNIINHLIENGRTTCVDLGVKLGISTSSASKRVDRLQRDDIIRIKAQVNPTQVGYNAHAFILIRVDHSRIDEIIQNLYPVNEIISIITLMNGYDIYLGTLDKDLKSIYEFIKKRMTHQAGIINIETLIGGEIIKRYYGASHLEGMVIK